MPQRTPAGAASSGMSDGMPRARPDYNAGWIAVERSTLSQDDRYITETAILFEGGFVETRRMRWDEPLDNVWTTSPRCYLVNMTLGVDAHAAATNLSTRTRPPAALGRLMLVPPGQTMQCSARRGHARSIRCALDAELFAPYVGDEAQVWTAEQLGDALHLKSGPIEWLMLHMYRELQAPDFASARVVRSLAEQLVVEIVRKYGLRRGDRDPYAGGLAPWRMRLIRDRLQSDAPPPDLQELATLCNLTVRHLSRAFRAETGQTIGRQIEAVMVSRANAMLASGRPVRDVAATLGYAKSGSFASAFRRATGLLPSEVKANGRHCAHG